MSDRDTWPDNPNDPPPRARQWEEKSSGGGCLKIALIVGGLSCIGMLVCCGGVGWFVWGFVPKVANTPADVAAVGQQVMQIKIPDEFVGKNGMSIDNWLIAMKFANYRHKEGKGFLLIGFMQVKFGDLSSQQADFNERTAEMTDDNHKLDIKKTEEREFTIRGKKETIRFSEANEVGTGKKFRQITGELKTPGSITILELRLEADAFDEEAVVKMIESIQ